MVTQTGCIVVYSLRYRLRITSLTAIQYQQISLRFVITCRHHWLREDWKVKQEFIATFQHKQKWLQTFWAKNQSDFGSISPPYHELPNTLHGLCKTSSGPWAIVKDEIKTASASPVPDWSSYDHIRVINQQRARFHDMKQRMEKKGQSFPHNSPFPTTNSRF